MSERDACSLMVVADRKSSALSSLRGKPGTFIIPAYSTGAVPPTAWVMSAVMDWLGRDRKSTRLNSSHSQISYAVFCLKKKKNQSLLAKLRSRCTYRTCVL